MNIKKVGFAVITSLSVFVTSISGSALARDSESTRKGTSSYPLYWIAYEEPFTTDVTLKEARWKANVDWVAKSLLPYGYKMVSTDGWIEGATQTNANGYILKHNDAWTHDWSYWTRYVNSKGLDMGVYYNPLWVTQAAVNDSTKKVIGTNIPVSKIVTAGDFFTGNPDPAKRPYWVDVTKDGAKEYIQGYVNYFKNMGVKFLRIDFLSWYESGGPSGSRAHGSRNYETALKWMSEAAGTDMVVSLVMPNLYNHGAVEKKYGDMIRIDNDAAASGWTHISKGSFGDVRQTWVPGWSQWSNPFQGFTGFSDISGRGSMTLDGDFFRINRFLGQYADNEKRSAFSLFTMAGSPIAVADQYDTIGNNLPYYTNRELISLSQEGFVGKPIYNNGNPFQPSTSYAPDTGSRDSERWIGQTTDGDWVVALFNRADTTKTLTIDFANYLGLSNGGNVRDLWAHRSLGFKTSHTVTLSPHDVSMIRISPSTSNPFVNRYQAEVGTHRNGANFNNNHFNHSGHGFVDKLEAASAGANVVIGVNADKAGTYNMKVRYANAMGVTSTGRFSVNDADNTLVSSGTLSFPSLENWDQWSTVSQNVTLSKGLNLITIARNANHTGAFNLDYIELDNRSPVTNAGFETGGITNWTEWHPTGQAAKFGVDSKDTHSGNYKLYFYNSSAAFKQSVHQIVKVPNGTYTISAAVKLRYYAGIAPTTARMELYGGSQVNVNITPSSTYQTITGKVTVSNGQLDIGFYLDAAKNTSLQIDTIKLTQ